MGTWTGDRRRIKPKRQKRIKTLVVTNPLLFAQRDKHNNVKEPLSWGHETLREASKNWPQVLIFCPGAGDLARGSSTPPTDLASTVESLGLHNVVVVSYTVTDPENATKIWKEHIIHLGGVYKPARNPREVTYLTLQRYFDAPHIVWAGPEDHKKAKVEIDKDKSFKDLQELRKKKAEW